MHHAKLICTASMLALLFSAGLSGCATSTAALSEAIHLADQGDVESVREYAQQRPKDERFQRLLDQATLVRDKASARKLARQGNVEAIAQLIERHPNDLEFVDLMDLASTTAERADALELAKSMENSGRLADAVDLLRSLENKLPSDVEISAQIRKLMSEIRRRDLALARSAAEKGDLDSLALLQSKWPSDIELRTILRVAERRQHDLSEAMKEAQSGNVEIVQDFVERWPNDPGFSVLLRDANRARDLESCRQLALAGIADEARAFAAKYPTDSQFDRLVSTAGTSKKLLDSLAESGLYDKVMQAARSGDLEQTFTLCTSMADVQAKACILALAEYTAGQNRAEALRKAQSYADVGDVPSVKGLAKEYPNDPDFMVAIARAQQRATEKIAETAAEREDFATLDRLSREGMQNVSLYIVKAEDARDRRLAIKLFGEKCRQGDMTGIVDIARRFQRDATFFQELERAPSGYRDSSNSYIGEGLVKLTGLYDFGTYDPWFGDPYPYVKVAGCELSSRNKFPELQLRELNGNMVTVWCVGNGSSASKSFLITSAAGSSLVDYAIACVEAENALRKGSISQAKAHISAWYLGYATALRRRIEEAR